MSFLRKPGDNEMRPITANDAHPVLGAMPVGNSHEVMRPALEAIEARAQELADRGGRIEACELGGIAEMARSGLTNNGSNVGDERGTTPSVSAERDRRNASVEAVGEVERDAAATAPPSAPPAEQPGCPERRKPGGCQLHNLHCRYPECDRLFESQNDSNKGANRITPAPQDTTDGVAEALAVTDAMLADGWIDAERAGKCLRTLKDEVLRLSDELVAQKQSTVEWHQMYLDGVQEIDRLRAAAPPDKKNLTGQGRGGS